MNEAEIYQEEENIMQAAAQHQDQLEMRERSMIILRKMYLLVAYYKTDFTHHDVDFIATMCGVSDYRK